MKISFTDHLKLGIGWMVSKLLNTYETFIINMALLLKIESQLQSQSTYTLQDGRAQSLLFVLQQIHY